MKRKSRRSELNRRLFLLSALFLLSKLQKFLSFENSIFRKNIFGLAGN